SNTSSTVNTTVNPIPTVNISSIANICDTAETFTLNQGSPSGGTYEVNGATATEFNPGTGNIGTNTVVYSYTENGCSNTAQTSFEVLNCSGIGIEELDLQISLYPNPSKGKLTIGGVEKERIEEVIVYDAIGKRVFSSQKSNQIDLEHLSDGLYRVSIKVGGKENIIPLQIMR
ncbi:MAG: T9SS type A sorting domain-containing protein, partial [Flavobacteriia bacterium]|nr:T9SS type A sorting domain-containing protein [Flavobacteriia bacterium]